MEDVEYVIFSDEPGNLLTDMVNNYLKDGWILYGPPIAANNHVYQAMIKSKTPYVRNFTFG